MTVHRTTLRTRANRAGRHLRVDRDHRRDTRLASDRGDVPGWVMITLMTAAIVVALWAVAKPQIVQIFETAMAPFLKGV